MAMRNGKRKGKGKERGRKEMRINGKGENGEVRNRGGR